MKYQSIREECCEANRALAATGLVDLTFGNVSVIDRASGLFAIKPSGVPYQDLRPDQMVVVDLEGKTVEGSLRVSSDTPTHRYLFREFMEIRSVVHTHSRHAVACAQAAREIACLGTTHADYFYGTVPVTRALTAEEIAGDYEWNTGVVIVERFRNLSPRDIPAVLVRGHGPFVWGATGAKAVEIAQALEIVAQIARDTLALNPYAESIPKQLLDKHFFRKHGTQAYYGQPIANRSFFLGP